MNGQYRPMRGPEFAGETRDQAIQHPAPFLFTGEEAIQLDVLNSTAGVTLQISGAMLGTGLELLPFAVSMVPTSNRIVTTLRFPVDSGWLQHIRVIVTAGSPQEGNCFVFVRVCRGTLSGALVLGTLAGGYVTPNTDLYWPEGPFQKPTDGAGWPQQIGITTPGAGTDFVMTVPTNARWEIVGVSMRLTASAAVANRLPRLIIDDGSNTLFEAPAPAAITAGQAMRVSWGAGAGGPVVFDSTSPGAYSSPIPNDIYLPAGFRVLSQTGGLDVADQWAAGNMLVREWNQGG